MRIDPYDPQIAFADVLGGKDKPQPVDLIDMAGATLRALRNRRLKPLPHSIDAMGSYLDLTHYTFEVPGKIVMGADKKIDEGQHPLFDLLRTRFRNAVGRPKLARVDTEESYTQFRNERRQPHLEALDARLSAIHAAVEKGNQDAWDRYEAEQAPFDYEYERHIVGIVQEAARGGKPVSLGLPARSRGKVECWVDGDEIIISVRLPCGIVTTGAPLQPEFQDVVGCAEAVGAFGEDSLVLGATLAPKTAGLRLLGDICRVAPVLGEIIEDAPTAVALKPQCDPGLAAAMALLQRCQRKDRQACREVMSIVHSSGSGADFIERAGECLARGQAEKAARQKGAS